MNNIFRIDDILMKKFQSTSDRFQDWTGLDNFFLTKLFLVINGVSTILIPVLLWLGEAFVFPFAFLALVVLYSATNRMIKLFRTIQKAYKNKNEEAASPGYLLAKQDRCTFLAYVLYWMFLCGLFAGAGVPILINAHLFPFDLLCVCTAFLFFIPRFCSEFAALYFMSCTPKPKKPSKIEEGTKKLTEIAEQALRRSPRVNPV